MDKARVLNRQLTARVVTKDGNHRLSSEPLCRRRWLVRPARSSGREGHHPLRADGEDRAILPES